MKRLYALLTALLLSLCLTLPAAAYNGVYVYDPDSILEETEAATLEFQAENVTELYNCAVYVFAIEDFTLYGYDDIYELAQDYYDENLLGCGEDRDGILMTLSTETRDVSLAVYGGWAQSVFTDYGQEIVWDAFLGDFGNDDWYTGASHYLSACETLLSAAQSGSPIGDATVDYGYDDAYTDREETSIGVMLERAVVWSILPAVVVAFLACGLMKKKMKTARTASGAAAYVSGSVDLKVRTDRYTHSTVVRTPIKTDDGPKGGGHHGGGGHHTSSNSRGFSGGSRKF